MNTMLLRYGEQRFLIDCGVNFPDPVHSPGASLIHASFEQLIKEGRTLTGIFLTHGHEDHIGALPYLLQHLDAPLYGTPFTLGLVRSKLAEFNLKPPLHTVKPGQILQVGALRVEWLAVPHSIPEACALILDTPQGRIVHSGDMKMDLDAEGLESGVFSRFGELGQEGVELLLLESTNVFVDGFARSERSLASSMEQIVKGCAGRIFFVTFASHIERMQTAIHAALQCGRKIAIAGSGIARNIQLARELGHLHLKERDIVDVSDLRRIPPERLFILATGSQGEPLATMARLGRGEMHGLAIQEGDTILWSSRWIPGNENAISYIQDQLIRRGADILDPPLYNIHVSGHGYRKDLQMALKLLRPHALVPIHGEQRFLREHRKLALQHGLPAEDIFVCQNGETLQLIDGFVRRAGLQEAPLVYRSHPNAPILTEEILRQRRQLKEGLLSFHLTLDAHGQLLGNIHIQAFGVPATSHQLQEEWPSLLTDALHEIPQTLAEHHDAIEDHLRRTLRAALKRNEMYPKILASVQLLPRSSTSPREKP
jgi:ribonuclease J